VKTEEEIENNRQAIIKAMKDNWIAKATVEYAGSGDSGQIEGVSFDYRERNGIDAMKDAVTVKVTEVSSRWEDGKFEQKKEEVEKELSAAIEDLCYDLLESKHPGWEINDGSSGQFTFDTKTGNIDLAHDDYYQESDRYEHGWGPSNVYDREPQ
jgi:hypothetical protein